MKTNDQRIVNFLSDKSTLQDWKLKFEEKVKELEEKYKDCEEVQKAGGIKKLYQIPEFESGHVQLAITKKDLREDIKIDIINCFEGLYS